MKKFIVKFWRSNPQSKNGGYYVEKEYFGRTENSARKKAEKDANKTIYGYMYVVDVKLAE